MIRLLIIADDFTGALDTAVKFSNKGIKVKVTLERKYEFVQTEDEEVIVIDADTRHLDKNVAYTIIFDIVQRAKKASINYIYKKTDSALRGNIGSELSAMVDVSDKKRIIFVPAFPQMNRVVKNGILYIDEIEVHNSIFGKDPFEPVRHSYIPEIIKEQSSVNTTILPIKETKEKIKNISGIVIYDACTIEELKKIGAELNQSNELQIMAGCAGFAEILPDLLCMTTRHNPSFQKYEKFLVVCGSINPITKQQIEYAQRDGFYKIVLTNEQKLNKLYWMTQEGKTYLENIMDCCKSKTYCTIDTNDTSEKQNSMDYIKEHNLSLEEVRSTIADNLTEVIKKILLAGYQGNILITGGDILHCFINKLNVKELIPIIEIEPGVVLSIFEWNKKTYQIMSKSGGFGGENLISELVKKTKL
mgnify:FL=1